MRIWTLPAACCLLLASQSGEAQSVPATEQQPGPTNVSYPPAPSPAPQVLDGGVQRPRYGIGRIVQFAYSPYQSYTILTPPGNITDITLGQDETVNWFMLGDSVRWQTVKTDHAVFIKPIQPGLQTSATLITNKRRYQLQLVSVEPGAQWYKQVLFSSPEIAVVQRVQKPAQVPAPSQPPKAPRAVSMPAPERPAFGMRVNLERMHDLYEIDSFMQPDWTPTQVVDDGEQTYIRIPESAQQLPALFVLKNGEPSIVNYRREGDWLVYPHLIESAVLKLGDDEVTIDRYTQ